MLRVNGYYQGVTFEAGPKKKNYFVKKKEEKRYFMAEKKEKKGNFLIKFLVLIIKITSLKLLKT